MIINWVSPIFWDHLWPPQTQLLVGWLSLVFHRKSIVVSQTRSVAAASTSSRQRRFSSSRAFGYDDNFQRWMVDTAPKLDMELQTGGLEEVFLLAIVRSHMKFRRCTWSTINPNHWFIGMGRIWKRKQQTMSNPRKPFKSAQVHVCLIKILSSHDHDQSLLVHQKFSPFFARWLLIFYLSSQFGAVTRLILPPYSCSQRWKTRWPPETFISGVLLPTRWSKAYAKVHGPQVHIGGFPSHGGSPSCHPFLDGLSMK